MSQKTLGCLKCGSNYDVIPPDGVYTEPRAKLDNPPGDFVEMKKECISCKNKNQFIGTSPKLNNNLIFRIVLFKPKGW
jgi:hypothetical protein